MRTLKELNIVTNPEPYCEHCGQLEPYTFTWSIEGDCVSSWCRSCAETFEEYNITDTEQVLIDTSERMAKIEYFERRLKELKT